MRSGDGRVGNDNVEKAGSLPPDHFGKLGTRKQRSLRRLQFAGKSTAAFVLHTSQVDRIEFGEQRLPAPEVRTVLSNEPVQRIETGLEPLHPGFESTFFRSVSPKILPTGLAFKNCGHPVFSELIAAGCGNIGPVRAARQPHFRGCERESLLAGPRKRQLLEFPVRRAFAAPS